MATNRIDKIKAARSLGDVLDIVSEIEYEFKNKAAIVKRLVASLSAAEMTFDVRGDTETTKGVKAKPKVVDDKYVAPPAAALKKHSDVINHLYDNVLELDAALAMIKQSFAGNKKLPAAVKSLKELTNSINDSLNDAFDALDAIAHKHRPKKLANFSDTLTGNIIDMLPKHMYDDIHRSVYVTQDSEDASLFHYCEYIGLMGLKNLQGYKYDQYYVIITAVVAQNGTMEFHINGLPDFKIPGRYPLGKAVTTLEQARRYVGLLFEHNNFVVDFDKLPMPLDTGRAKHAGILNIPGVKNVRIVDDTLSVQVDPAATAKAVDNIIASVMGRLNSIVGGRKEGKIFQYKRVPEGKPKRIDFILLPDLGNKKMHFSVEKLKEVADYFNFSDKQMAALRFSLQHEPKAKE